MGPINMSEDFLEGSNFHGSAQHVPSQLFLGDVGNSRDPDVPEWGLTNSAGWLTAYNGCLHDVQSFHIEEMPRVGSVL
jgi:hypothetical protein